MNQNKNRTTNPIVGIVKNNVGILSVLVLLCVIVSIATSKFLKPNNLISVLRQISINAYIALGMTLIIILGTELMAAFPTGWSSPGRVTLPTPSPPSMITFSPEPVPASEYETFA